MRKLWIASFFAAALLRGATLDSGTVTVSATRTLTVQPDQFVLYITLMAAPDAGLDTVLAQLKGLGVTSADLTYVTSQTPIFQQVDVPMPQTLNSQWTFTLPVAFTKMNNTMTALNQLQASLGQSALNYNVVGTQYSADALASQPCPYPALVFDARKQADVMAAAAGMKTGAIVSVSDGTSVEAGVAIGGVGAPAALARIGDFSQSFGFISSFSSTLITSPQPACSVTVQFKLLP